MSGLLSKGDPLLRRMRRIAAEAKSVAETGDARRIRWAEADLRAVIEKLGDYMRELDREVGVVVRRRKAVSAYSRCFNLGRR